MHLCELCHCTGFFISSHLIDSVATKISVSYVGSSLVLHLVREIAGNMILPSSSYVPLTPSQTFLTPDGQFDSIELTIPISQARPRLRSRGIQGIVDPALGDSYPREIFEDMAELALECSVFNKDDRPSMKVMNMSYHGSNFLASNM